MTSLNKEAKNRSIHLAQGVRAADFALKMQTSSCPLQIISMCEKIGDFHRNFGLPRQEQLNSSFVRQLQGHSMTTSIHNPDQYMSSLRQIIAQGRKRIGLLVGAGAPAGIIKPGTTDEPLIPAVSRLTKLVLGALEKDYGKPLKAVCDEIADPNIENVLSRIRSLSTVIGSTKVHGLDGDGHKGLSEAICKQIGEIVNQDLPDGQSAFSELVAWIGGTDRVYPIEIFTTNYDLLFEQALERAKLPYFDGFTGSSAPFFDPSTVANNRVPTFFWGKSPLSYLTTQNCLISSR